MVGWAAASLALLSRVCPALWRPFIVVPIASSLDKPWGLSGPVYARHNSGGHRHLSLAAQCLSSLSEVIQG